MKSLPMEIQRLIFEFDSTFHEKYKHVVRQMSDQLIIFERIAASPMFGMVCCIYRYKELTNMPILLIENKTFTKYLIKYAKTPVDV